MSPVAEATTVVETLASHGLSTMARVVRVAGLDAMISSAGPFTLVASNEDAFATMPAARRAGLLRDRGRARAFVLDQLIAGALPRQSLRDGLQTLTMYAPGGLAEAGHRLTWALRGAVLSVDGARVADAFASMDDVVYVADALLPPAPEVVARPSRARPGQRVTVVCRRTRADGTPVADAHCTFAWHFGDWIPHDQASTNARGIARCTRVVPAQPGTDRVLVTVTTRGTAPTRTVLAAFGVR